VVFETDMEMGRVGWRKKENEEVFRRAVK